MGRRRSESHPTGPKTRILPTGGAGEMPSSALTHGRCAAQRVVWCRCVWRWCDCHRRRGGTAGFPVRCTSAIRGSYAGWPSSRSTSPRLDRTAARPGSGTGAVETAHCDNRAAVLRPRRNRRRRRGGLRNRPTAHQGSRAGRAQRRGIFLKHAGTRDPDAQHGFLATHAAMMPRPALRLAVEKLDPVDRARYLS
jgi:hypothetical protein